MYHIQHYLIDWHCSCWCLIIIIIILFFLVLSLSVTLVSTHFLHSAHPFGAAWFFMCVRPTKKVNIRPYTQPHKMKTVHSCDTRLSYAANKILDLWTTDRSRMPVLSVTGKNAAALYHIAERMHWRMRTPRAEKFFYSIIHAMPEYT